MSSTSDSVSALKTSSCTIAFIHVKKRTFGVLLSFLYFLYIFSAMHLLNWILSCQLDYVEKWLELLIVFV